MKRCTPARRAIGRRPTRRRRPGPPLGGVAVVVLVLSGLASPAGARPTLAADAAPPPVPLGTEAVSLELAPGEERSFRVDAPADVFLDLRLDAEEAGFELVLRPPGVAATSDPTVPDGAGGDVPGETIGDPRTITAWAVTRRAGPWILVVRRSASAAAPARARLERAALRPPTPTERRRHEARDLVEIGWLAWHEKRWDDAIEVFGSALEASDDGDYPRGVAEVHHGLGEVFQKLGRRAEALARFEAAAELWRQVPDLRFRAMALQQLAREHQAIDGPEAALPAFDEAVEAAEQAGDMVRLAEAWRDRCRALHQIGRLLDALADCEAARDLAWVHHRREAHEPLIQLGLRIYRDLGEIGRAEASLERALELIDERPPADADARRAVVFQGLGMMSDYRGDYEEAIGRYARGLRLIDPDEHPATYSLLLHNTGTAYKGLGRLDKMLEYYRRAAALAPDETTRLDYLLSIDWVLVRQGRLAEAEELFVEALALAERVGTSGQRALTAKRHGELLLAAGRPDEALAPLGEALEGYRRLGNRWGEAHVHETLAEAHMARGDDRRARSALERALELNQAIGDLGEQAENLFALARIEHRRGDRQAALAALEETLAVVDTLRLQASHDQVRSFVGARAQPYYDLYVELLMARHAEAPTAGFDRQALRVHERARARSLLDLVAEQRAELEAAEMPPELAAEHAELVRRLAAAELERQRLARSGEDGGQGAADELSALRIEIDQLLASLRDVERRSREASRRYEALASPRPATVSEIQETLLDDDTLLVELRLGDERSFLWAVGVDRLEAFFLPPRREIEADARCFYLLLTEYGTPRPAEALPAELGACLGARFERYRRPDAAVGELGARRAELAAALDDVGRRLSEAVLGPLERAGLLASPRLAVVPDGMLEYVPFAALPRPGAAGSPPLVASHEIVHLPSATVAAFLAREVRAAPPDELALVADPIYHLDDPRLLPEIDQPPAEPGATRSALDERLPTLRRLPFAGEEARVLRRLADPDRSWVALGLDASRSAILDRPLERYRFVHFATHGVLDAAHPELSGLILSTVGADGPVPPAEAYLRLHDVYRLRLRAELVVLSACETALGPEARGEGLLGLARGFVHAGARRVVASLWQVQDRATAELVGHLYAGLLDEGRPAAEALRRAQLELRRSGGEHPYYWAGLVLQGDWR